jgi:hypothetical protein
MAALYSAFINCFKNNMLDTVKIGGRVNSDSHEQPDAFDDQIGINIRGLDI